MTAWLRARFGENSVCPAREWHELAKLDRREILAYRALAGHFAMDLDAVLGKRLAVVSVLRNPVDRTISHYRHVVRDAGHPRHTYVARQSPDEFVLDETNWPMIENFQARYFLRTPMQLRLLMRRLDAFAPKARSLSVLAEDSRYLLDKSFVREKSKAALSTLAVVGTTDNLGAFFAAVAQLDRPGKALAIPPTPHENAAPAAGGQASFSQPALDVLRELTRIDQEIYDDARYRMAGKAAA